MKILRRNAPGYITRSKIHLYYIQREKFSRELSYVSCRRASLVSKIHRALALAVGSTLPARHGTSIKSIDKKTTRKPPGSHAGAVNARQNRGSKVERSIIRGRDYERIRIRQELAPRILHRSFNVPRQATTLIPMPCLQSSPLSLSPSRS